MRNQNPEPLEQVLNNFDIHVQSISSETYKDKKAVWWVETEQGLMVLKKVSNSEQTLKFTISAIKHLSKNGIHLPPIKKTREGTDYAAADGSCYVLSEAIKGRNPSYDSELEIIIKGLAAFHSASRGFQVLPDTKPKQHLGQWVEDLTYQIEDMRVFYDKEVAGNGLSNIGKYIINEFPYFYNRAVSAIHSLRSEGYKTWVEKARLQGALCHQDFTAGNLILHPSGNLYVLDTDGITIDIPARDLRKIILKMMKKSGKWDSGLAKKVFHIYQSVNPLQPSEWSVVMADIKFPHLFIGAMNKYYYQRDKEWSENKYFDRIKEMCAFEKSMEPALGNYEMLMHNIYKPSVFQDTPIISTTIETAEMIKYASNAFLAAKISYINEIANICELCGADVRVVAKAMGLDKRIGEKFLKPGPGFGGSCFPKDTKALIKTAKDLGYTPEIVTSVMKSNLSQQRRAVQKIINAVGEPENKTFTILGVAFIPETDDIRASTSIYIIEELLRIGGKIKAFDPKALNNMKELHPELAVEYCDNTLTACEGSDCIIVATEWEQFRGIDFEIMKGIVKNPVLIDLRNMFEPGYIKDLGFLYIGTGRQ